MLLEIVFVIFSFSFAQVSSNGQFLQETVTVFTLDDGLPETVFSEIRLDEPKNIVAPTNGYGFFATTLPLVFSDFPAKFLYLSNFL